MPAPPSTASKVPRKDALALVEDLVDECGNASPEVLQAVVNRLRDAGIIPTPSAEAAVGDGRELKNKLGIPVAESLDRARLADLARRLVDLATKIDEVTWQVWSQLTPTSDLRPLNPLSRSITRFLREGGTIPTEALYRDLDRLMRLNVSVLWATVRVASPFYVSVLKNLSPNDIWAVIPGADLPGFPAKSAKCWRRYSEIAKSLNPRTVEVALHRELETIVKSLLE